MFGGTTAIAEFSRKQTSDDRFNCPDASAGGFRPALVARSGFFLIRNFPYVDFMAVSLSIRESQRGLLIATV